VPGLWRRDDCRDRLPGAEKRGVEDDAAVSEGWLWDKARARAIPVSRDEEK